MNTSLSIFARALASENISFSFDQNAETAGFDVKTRHLVMPVWNVSDTVKTMLVAHEISHALWTPYERSEELFAAAEKEGYCVPLLQRICNVIEDIRIEKKMKEKFPGTRRDFFLGYKEIVDLDLFKFKSMDLEKASFISRINLHYKWGAFGFLTVNFDAVEREIVDAADRVTTFDQAFDLAKVIYDHPSMQSIKDQAEREEKKQQQQKQKSSLNGLQGKGDGGSDPSNETAAMDKILDNLLPDSASFARHDGEEYIHASVTIPSVKNLSNGMITTGSLLKEFDSYASRDVSMTLNMSDYKKFEKQSEAYVRQLAAQFERRKAADEIRRERPKQTGMLNLDRLHQYRTHDDIFLSKIVKQDGKNHGITFLLDFSGSMSNVIGHAYQQVLQLVWFCEKAKIPFEVFGFTDVHCSYLPGFVEERNAWRDSHNHNMDGFVYSRAVECTRSAPTAITYGNAKLINIASSRDSATDRERLLAYIYDQFVGRNRHIPALTLHGTPTVESVALVSQFMVDWVRDNDIQIPTLMVVTDGDPNGVYTQDDSKSKAWYYIQQNNSLTVTNDILGTTTTVHGRDCSGLNMANAVVGTMLNGLREKLNARCIGMYVGPRVFSDSLFQRYCLSRKETVEQQNSYKPGSRGWDTHDSARYDAAHAMYQDDGCVILHEDVYPGYDAYFLIRTPQIVKDEDAIADGGTFTKVKNTFIRTMARRGGSRVFLSRYVDIVAGQPIRKMADGLYNLSPWASASHGA